MFVFKILAHPINEMVLENPLDKLVKEVWHDQLVDVGVRKVLRERLARCVRQIGYTRVR